MGRNVEWFKRLPKLIAPATASANDGRYNVPPSGEGVPFVRDHQPPLLMRLQIGLRVQRVQGRRNCRDRRVLIVVWSIGGRFAQHVDQLRLHRFTVPVRNLQPHHNVAPTETVDVIMPQHGGHAIVPMRWGLVAWWWWWKEPLKELPATFNAWGLDVATPDALKRYRWMPA